MKQNRKQKLWGGRFRKSTAPLMERFGSSLAFDRRLYRADIQAGIAHARVLQRGGYLTLKERDRIVTALSAIRREIEAGEITFRGRYEDIHSLIIDHLIKKVGPLGKKLHAGRSRNDLIVLDVRLYLREALGEVDDGLIGLQRALVTKALEYEDVILPGYTHLQRAQPVLFAHHLLAYVEMLERDRGRLRDALRRMDVLPSGSAALAGTSLNLDQRYLARLLGFAAVAVNSIDAVSDRDFIAEVLSALALVGIHLSRLAEELVLWSTSEFGFVRLDEAYCTGSSFLPHKLNPDPAELIRGKAGRLCGNLLSVLVVMKGLPLSYNRDLQEDKEPLFDSLATVRESLKVAAAVMATLAVDRPAVKRAVEGGFSAAADLAEHLVKKGIPFGEAHRLVGNLVVESLERGKDFSTLTLGDLKACSPDFDATALRLLRPAGSVKNKATAGSTAPAKVKSSLKKWKKKLNVTSQLIATKARRHKGIK